MRPGYISIIQKFWLRVISVKLWNRVDSLSNSFYVINHCKTSDEDADAQLAKWARGNLFNQHVGKWSKHMVAKYEKACFQIDVLLKATWLSKDLFPVLSVLPKVLWNQFHIKMSPISVIRAKETFKIDSFLSRLDSWLTKYGETRSDYGLLKPNPYSKYNSFGYRTRVIYIFPSLQWITVSKSQILTGFYLSK